MSMNRHHSRLLTGLVLASMLLSACGGDNAAPVLAPTDALPTASLEPAPEATPAATEDPSLGPVSGLTGLPVRGGLARPLAVMINNAPAARPQSGVSEADVLYEVLAEGGITRLIGIFQSQTGVVKIGPIRSIRPYLIDIGESFGAVTVHAGGSPAAYAILQSQRKDDLDEIGNAGAYFWRDKERKAPHNLYSNDAKLREGADKLGYADSTEVPQFNFADPDFIPLDGEPAAAFDVQFLLQSYTVGYTYDEAKRTYARSVNGAQHLDLNNSNPVEAANVMVLGTEHKVLDDVGRLSIDVELGGEAMLFQRGNRIEGRWSRQHGDMIRFIKEDGTEAQMYPGVTHILIVPVSPSFESHVEVTLPESST